MTARAEAFQPGNLTWPRAAMVPCHYVSQLFIQICNSSLRWPLSSDLMACCSCYYIIRRTYLLTRWNCYATTLQGLDVR